MPTLDDAIALDRSDPIAGLRAEFEIDEDGPIYADGNSLGRLCRGARDVITRTVDQEWGQTLVRSWNEWFDLPERVGDLIATTMLGAAPGETIAADSTTVNFYKLAVAALRHGAPGRRVVISDRANFPSDRFVLQGLDADVRFIEDAAEGDAAAEAIASARGDLALVTLSHVDYRSGARHDLGAITELAHDAGALVLWDLSHSAGAVEIDLGRHGVDLAVGCTYKYLNGGPGAPAFLYVRGDLQERLVQPVHGWFGAADQFRLAPRYLPAPGIRRFLSGTPPVVALRTVEAAVSTLAGAGIGALAAKGRALSDFVIQCADDVLAAAGFTVLTPREPDRRGAHVSLRHNDAWRICRAAIERAGVVPDFREPDVLRLGLAPAYTRFVDAYEAVVRIAELVESGGYQDLPDERSRVT